eukprot:5825622-Amphidinium_carterae.1
MVQVDTAVTRNTEGAGVGYYTDTQERRSSVPHEVVSDCKGVVKAVQTLQTGRRTPKDATET